MTFACIPGHSLETTQKPWNLALGVERLVTAPARNVRFDNLSRTPREFSGAIGRANDVIEEGRPMSVSSRFC
jgi:hypothetical protein